MVGTNADDFDDYLRAKLARHVRFAYMLCGHRADAEDLVADVLESCYPKWRRITDRGDPDKYVRGAIIKRVRSRHRKAFRRYEASTSTVPDAPDPGLDVDQQVLHFMALQQLSRVARIVVVARVEGGLSWNEVGELVGYSTRQAQRIYNDAIAELRTILGARSYG